MRYAIISDIHANIEALSAVLSKIEQEGADRIICLGDLVGYYADPNECVRMIRERQIPCVTGNHDRVATGQKEPLQFGQAAKQAIFWTRENLSDESRRFLTELPMLLSIDDRFLAVHASLHPEPNEDIYLNSREQAQSSLQRLTESCCGPRLCFFGHTHRGVVYQMRDGQMSGEQMTARAGEEEVKLDPAAYYLINPGSVGRPRDRDPRASFLIYDSEASAVRFHRVAYDIESRDRKAARAGLLYQETLISRAQNLVTRWMEAARAATGHRWPG